MQSENTHWRLNLFGRVELVGNGVVISNFGTARAAKLLVLLSLSRSGEMSRERLADLLWPDDYYDSTRLRLRQEIHRLKRALEPAGEWLMASTQALSLDRSFLKVELHELDRLDATDSLPDGEFLPGWEDAWVVSERRNAEEVRIRAAIRVSSRWREAGDSSASLNTVAPLIQRFPLHEGLRLSAMQAHAHGGSLAAAVSEYQDFRNQVKTKLGGEPSDAATAMLESLSVAPIAVPMPTRLTWPSLPQPTDEIVGRAETLDQVSSQLLYSRWVCLTGPGGIGKTRIALEISHKSSLRTAFISLADLGSGGNWGTAILGELNIDSPSQESEVRFLASTLNSQPTLLVLDNAENIPELHRNDLVALLQLAPQLRILTTSTHPFRRNGEVVVAVGPLENNGIDLLISAAKRVRPLVMSHPDSASIMAEVARRLDGYPLALRLAAARLRFLSPSQLLGSLDQLSGNASWLPERHRSLQSAMRTSVEGVSTDARELLNRLSAYPGGLGMDLAQRVLGDLDYLILLEQLLDAALITLDEKSNPVRVRLLEPVREYLKTNLTAEESVRREREMVEQCREWLAEIGAGPTLPLTTAIFEALDSEIANLLEAVERSIAVSPEIAVEMVTALAPYQIARGRSRDFATTLRRIGPDTLSADLRVDLWLTDAGLHLGAYMEESVLETLERARVEPLSDIQYARLKVLESSYALRRDYDRADEVTAAALEAAKAVDNNLLATQVHYLKGVIAIFRQDIQGSIKHLSIAFDEFRRMQANFEASDAGLRLSFQLWQVGRRAEASDVVDQCRVLLADSRNPVRRAFLHETTGRLALADGRANAAELEFRESLKIWAAIGSPFQEADQLLSLTRALLAQEKWAEARRSLVAAADGWVADENYGGLSQSLSSLAILLDKDGRTDEARKALGYSQAMQTDHRLFLVQPELDFRDEVARKLGGYLAFDQPTTLAAARSWFDEIR